MDLAVAVPIFKESFNTPATRDNLQEKINLTNLPPWDEIMALENDLEWSYFANCLYLNI